MNLDVALMTVASAGLWLVGCCAFVSAAQEWVQGRSKSVEPQQEERCD